MNKLLVDGIYATNIVKLKDIAEKKTTKNIDGLVTETFTNSAENGIISQSDFFDRTITNDKNISGYFIVEPDDFVYNPRISTFAPVGPINRNKLGRSGVMSPLYLVFHTHDVEPEYLEWYFKSNAWHQFMRDNGNTGARSDRFSISDAEFFNMPIPIPPVEVQKTIAKTLTTLDTKVTLEKNEVEKFQNLKSAMLTKMFPKKGENVPEIRFPGFTDAWEQRKVSEVAEICAGGTPSTGIYRYWYPKEIPWVSSGEVHKKYITFTDNKISIEGMNNSSARMIPENSVLIALAGQGKTRGTVAINRIPLTTNQSIAAMTFFNEIVPEFVFSNLENRYEEIRRMSSGDGSRGGLNKQIVGDIEIPYTSKEEQDKIGECFNNLDHLITLHQRKYEKLIDTKKAFLEKLIGGEK